MMVDYWSLRYEGVDVTFDDDSGIYLRYTPELADYDIIDEDRNLPRADGSTVGQDFHGGRTIGITFGISGASEAEMWDRFGLLASYWNAAAVRAVPGALVELVSERGRSAFGRPRKIAPSDVVPTARMMTVETTFWQADKLWYGEEDTLEVPFGLTQGGGLVSPLRSPLVARGYSSRSNTFTVGGTEPTWPRLVIRGPILNPTVEVAGQFRHSAEMSLAYDETLTIDTRPGRGTVLRNGTQMAALTRSSTLLNRSALPPGKYACTLSGSSSTGNPTALLAWRAANLTP